MTEGAGFGYQGISILNATATGFGCAMAVNAGIHARYLPTESPLAGESELVRAIRARIGIPSGRIQTRAALPPSRGFKSSSAAATACLGALGVAPEEWIPTAIQASIDAGVTLTGAFDDQVMATIGGCHLTNNTTQELLQVVEPWSGPIVLAWNQDSIPKAQLRSLNLDLTKAKALDAMEALLDGDLVQAVALNREAYLGTYEQAGLPMPNAAMATLQASGAVEVGLTGTGPGCFGLFDEEEQAAASVQALAQAGYESLQCIAVAPGQPLESAVTW